MSRYLLVKFHWNLWHWLYSWKLGQRVVLSQSATPLCVGWRNCMRLADRCIATKSTCVSMTTDGGQLFLEMECQCGHFRHYSLQIEGNTRDNDSWSEFVSVLPYQIRDIRSLSVQLQWDGHPNLCVWQTKLGVSSPTIREKVSPPPLRNITPSNIKTLENIALSIR